MGEQLRIVHGAILEIVGMMNGPERDEAMIREAGIKLDRALFPLLVLIDRFGSIGVVDLASRVGRDYSTVSRQLGKLEALDLIERRGIASDRRVREASVKPAGKETIGRIDEARDRILGAGFAKWSSEEMALLVKLMPKLAQAMRDGVPEPVGEGPGNRS